MRLRWTISSLAYRIPLLDHSIYQYEIGPFLTASQKWPSHKYGYGEKRFWQCASQGFNNGEEESRRVWRVSMWRLWMNQSCFFLGFLSQKFLWKLYTFPGYKALYIVGWERNVKSQFFPNRVVWWLDLMTGLSREFKPWANGQTGTFFLLCNSWHDSSASPHTPYVCQLWRHTSHKSPASPAASICILAQS